jgi:hypothetical protein
MIKNHAAPRALIAMPAGNSLAAGEALLGRDAMRQPQRRGPSVQCRRGTPSRRGKPSDGVEQVGGTASRCRAYGAPGLVLSCRDVPHGPSRSGVRNPLPSSVRPDRAILREPCRPSLAVGGVGRNLNDDNIAMHGPSG